MKVYLPNSAFLGNIDPFIKKMDVSDRAKLEITANKKWISIHPVVLTMVAALGIPLKAEKIHCDPLEAKSRHYLERMGLFRILGIESNMEIIEHESSGRFIPLTNIRSTEGLSRFITDMIPLLHLESKQADPIKYIVSELVRNVLEHSESNYGAVLCAQYYKKSNVIRIGIADTGVGIKETINAAHTTTSHLEALRLAMIPGITGTTRREGGTDFNAGAGLFFIKSIAKVNRDFFMIYSGDSMYKLLKSSPGKKSIKLYADPLKDRHSTTEELPLWDGTVVGIDITLDTTHEFSSLLDQIRNTYITTIQERRKGRKRRPRFI